MEERRHAECLAKVQTDAVQLALDLLAREPDSVESFFEMFTKTLVEECESLACDVWLTDEDEKRVELWMTYQRGRLYTPQSRDWDEVALPRESMAGHLFGYIPGWTSAVVYEGDDPRLPAPIRALIRSGGDRHGPHRAARARRAQSRLDRALERRQRRNARNGGSRWSRRSRARRRSCCT